MSIFVDENTKVVVPGPHRLAGPLLRAAQPRRTAPRWSAGTNPKKAGTDVEGIPVFATVAEAVEATGADGVVRLRARAGRRRRGDRGGRGGIELIVVHHRGRPRPGRGALLQHAEAATTRARRLLGPNCPGIITPGKCNIGITAGEIATAGRAGRHRQPLGHAHLPGAVRADAEGHRRDDVRRHRRRPRAGHDVHRLPRGVRGRPRRPRPSIMIGEIGGSAEERRRPSSSPRRCASRSWPTSPA